MARNLISLSNICKTYIVGGARVDALKDLTLDIVEGDFVAIMGPSGSGKSSLLNVIGLLDQPTRGRYVFADQDVSKLDHEACALFRSCKIGFVFQNFSLLGRNTAVENVELPMIYSGVGKDARMTRAKAALRSVGLEDRGHHWPAQLSGGEQQRVAIARALTTNPAIILADEPTGALDSKTGFEIMSILRKLNDAGTTIVLVTHDAHVARQAKRIVAMQDGYAISNDVIADRLDPAEELAKLHRRIPTPAPEADAYERV